MDAEIFTMLSTHNPSQKCSFCYHYVEPLEKQEPKVMVAEDRDKY